MDKGKHLKVLASLYIVFGLIGVITIIAMLYEYRIIIFYDVVNSPYSKTFHDYLFFGMIFIPLFTIVNFVIAYGLLKYKNWCRIFTIIISILNLAAIPIGTILGIYGLGILFNDEVKDKFTNKTVSSQN